VYSKLEFKALLKSGHDNRHLFWVAWKAQIAVIDLEKDLAWLQENQWWTGAWSQAVGQLLDSKCSDTHYKICSNCHSPFCFCIMEPHQSRDYLSYCLITADNISSILVSVLFCSIDPNNLPICKSQKIFITRQLWAWFIHCLMSFSL